MSKERIGQVVVDILDRFDRYFYGRRLNSMIIGSLIVLLIAPLLDSALEIRDDRLTYLSTATFTVYVLLIFFAYLASLRDGEGKWTLDRTKSRLKCELASLREFLFEHNGLRNETIYRTSLLLVLGSICWRALVNASMFTRHIVFDVTSVRVSSLLAFERFTLEYLPFVFILGLILVAYVLYTDGSYRERTWSFLRRIVKTDKAQPRDQRMSLSSGWTVLSENARVIDVSSESTMRTILTNSSPEDMYLRFVKALSEWKPRRSDREYVYQDHLIRHLRRAFPDTSVVPEYIIGDVTLGNRGRADIVIDDFILVEMKASYQRGAVQRAKGQIHQYAETWSGRGPVVLLLCKVDYEAATRDFSSMMGDLAIGGKRVITIVVP